MADQGADDKAYQDYLDDHAYQQYLSQHQSGGRAPSNPIDRAKAYLGPMDIGKSVENLAGAQAYGPAKSVLGRIAQGAGLAGAQAAGSDPGDLKSKAASGGIAALLGGGMSAAAEGVSAVGSKLGDYLMQRSVGMRKNTPGAGNRLVDQGVWGTKNHMTSQVESKLPEAENTVQEIVSGLPDKADPSEISAAVASRGDKFVLPNGEIPPNVQPDAAKVQSAAKGISQLGGYQPEVPSSSYEAVTGRTQYGDPVSEARTTPGTPEKKGSLSMQDVLGLKRQGDWVGYTNSGTPASSLDSELGRAQADASRSILERASGGASKDALADEQALILAKKALTKPETIHQGGPSSIFFGKVPGQSLMGSTAAHAAQKGGEFVGDATPKITQSLFGEKKDK